MDYDSHKKEWCSESYCNTTELWKHYPKGKKPDIKEYMLYDFIYINVQNRQIYRGKKYTSSCLELEWNCKDMEDRKRLLMVQIALGRVMEMLHN